MKYVLRSLLPQSSCAFGSEQKIQLNGCKSPGSIYKTITQLFLQVRKLSPNAEWEWYAP